MNFTLTLLTAAKLINNQLMTFDEFVNSLLCSKKDFENFLTTPSFITAISDKQLFTKGGLKRLIDSISSKELLHKFNENHSLLRLMVESESASLQDLTRKYSSISQMEFCDEDLHISSTDARNNSCLYLLLRNNEDFEYFIDNDLISKKDCEGLLQYILDYEPTTIEEFCRNISLVKYFFENFLIDNLSAFSEVAKRYFNNDFFGSLRHKCRFHKDVLRSIDQYEAVCNLKYSKKRKQEVFEILKNSETARSALKLLVDNNLLDQYDFETLKNLLNKTDNKKKIKMNF